MAVFGYKGLAGGCCPLTAYRTPGGARRIVGAHLDKPAGLGVHSCLPHHLRVVFAKPFGTLDGGLYVAELCEYSVFSVRYAK